VVPGRFGSWVLETTAEALSSLASIVDEADEMLGIDGAAALLGGVGRLRADLAKAEARHADLRARTRRVYGDVYLYDFPPEMDVEWRLGSLADGTQALLASPAGESDVRAERALIPPSSVTPWRWTEPALADEHGRFLLPPEARALAPREYHAWVAAKTYEALLEARRLVNRLGRSAVSGADDLAALARAAGHAQELASLGGGGLRLAMTSPAVTDEDAIADTETPDGRIVRLDGAAWQHIVASHPGLESQLDLVVDTLRSPDHREPDPRVGRERFFRRGGPETWVRVVVEFKGSFDRVVTAFPQSNDPEGWNLG
jgi:hypothetical protein